MGQNATGAGGTLALTTPTGPYNFSTVSELTISGGSTYAVYEVVDGQPGGRLKALRCPCG